MTTKRLGVFHHPPHHPTIPPSMRNVRIRSGLTSPTIERIPLSPQLRFTSKNNGLQTLISLFAFTNFGAS
jgi:hypothetical protein